MLKYFTGKLVLKNLNNKFSFTNQYNIKSFSAAQAVGKQAEKPQTAKAAKGGPQSPQAQAKQEKEVAASTPFKPLEEFSREDLKDRLRDFRKETYYNRGSIDRLLENKTFNKTEFMAKKMRHMWLQAGDFSTNKHVIPVKRLRERKDTLFGLLKNGEIAGLLEGREEFPDFHFVIDRHLTKRLDTMPHGKVKPFYLKNGNDEIRCTLIKKDRLPTQDTPVKVRFQRYIVGRPNLLTLPIKLTNKFYNPYVGSLDVELAQYYHEVDVWCTTDDYPPILEIDTRLITPGKPFKFLNLNLFLPEGMWLHRKYDSVMYNSIASMGENFNLIIAGKQYPLDEPGTSKEKEDQENEEARQIDALIDRGLQVKKTKKGPSMPFSAASSKKIMQAKNEGADKAAIRKVMQSGGGEKKKKK